MIGQEFGHYRVLEQIGAGGMGLVYRAHDERLDRDVALKVLPAGTLADEAARKRFRKEALTLSKLNHPNIETVHDFDTHDGVDFLVMELIPGISLDQKLLAGPLPEKEVLQLGQQLAEGLAAAHAEAIIHRDLKPGNLRLTPDGRLKILDFGLAKLFREVAATDVTASFTESQAVTGTLPYMAPEQLRGERTDARSDIWAAGAVIYEMATGRRPFPQQSGPMLTEAILHQDPQLPSEMQPSVSASLEAVIVKALDKDAEHRYQSAKELRVDLERLSEGARIHIRLRASRRARWKPAMLMAALVLLAVATSLYLRSRGQEPIQSLAVLPLVNASGDPNTEYFSDGVTESLIDSLSQVPDLKIIAKTSVFRYKGRQADLQTVARELGVRAVLTGRVTRRADDMFISVELVDTQNNRQLWGEQYNRKASEVFVVQNEIAKEISQNLKLRLTGGEKQRLTKRYTQSPEAHELYLKGRYFWRKFTAAGTAKAIDYFQQAIEKEPSYALAYAGLADAYALGSLGGGGIAPAEGMPKAKAAARKALELDDTLAEAHLSLALVRAFYEWDWAGANAEFARAIQLNPSGAEAHHFYSHYFTALGHTEESLAESKKALELDPLSPDLTWHLAWHYNFARQYDKAIEQAAKTFELDPNSTQARLVRGGAYQNKRMFQQAITEFQKVRAASAGTPAGLADLAYAYALSGNTQEARKNLEELTGLSKRRHVPAYSLATVHAGLGEKDQAFAWLDKACDERGFYVHTLKVDPRLDSLRSDPRFASVLRRVGLPQ
ncbi:MAG: protein kinase domain-containing protein [Terriglobales bacterium]